MEIPIRNFLLADHTPSTQDAAGALVRKIGPVFMRRELRIFVRDVLRFDDHLPDPGCTFGIDVCLRYISNRIGIEEETGDQT